MIKKEYLDQASAITSNDSKKRNFALQELYDDCFKKTEQFVLNNSGTKEESKDVFQEGMVILYQNITNKKYVGDASPSAYLFSICRNLWLQILRKKKISIDSKEYNERFEEHVTLDVGLIHSVLNELKKDCRKLLRGFYYEKKSMKELMEDFKVGSIQAIKNKKLACMKALIKVVKKNGITYDRFIN